jgi:hypothetical protein
MLFYKKITYIYNNNKRIKTLDKKIILLYNNNKPHKVLDKKNNIYIYIIYK